VVCVKSEPTLGHHLFFRQHVAICVERDLDTGIVSKAGRPHTVANEDMRTRRHRLNKRQQMMLNGMQKRTEPIS
jgi:hypothetical protein